MNKEKVNYSGLILPGDDIGEFGKTNPMYNKYYIIYQAEDY